MDVVVGVDAYKGGWVTVALRDRSVERCGVYVRIEELLEDHSEASTVGVDIPIGLPAKGAREADALARTFVGPRRSSVFSTPPRAVLEAATYQEALEVTRNLGVVGISKQSFGLAPKILEVDEIARSDERVVEVHPEVSFRAMAGQTLKYSKSHGMAPRSDDSFWRGMASCFPTIWAKPDWPPLTMCWTLPQQLGRPTG